MAAEEFVMNRELDAARRRGKGEALGRSWPTWERRTGRVRLGWLLLAGAIAWAAAIPATPAIAADSLFSQPHPAPTEAVHPGILHDAAITPAPAGSEHPLVFGNRTIATLRAVVLGRGPAERARSAADRIRGAFRHGRSDSVTIQSIPQALALRVGGETIFALTQYDVDPEADETLEAAAEKAAASLRLVIIEYREQRSWFRIAKAVGGTLVATAIAFFLARGLGAFRVRLVALLHRTTSQHLHGRAQSMAHASAGHIAGALGRSVDVLGIGGLIIIGYMWLTFCLRSFPYTRPWGEQLRSYLLSSVAGIALTFVRALPGLFTVAVIFIITRWFTKMVNHLFHSIEHGTFQIGWIEPEIAAPTRRIANVLLWLFAILIAYPYLPGSGSDAFKGLSVFVGLIISLGSSGVVNQAMSGFVLMYARMLKRGDYVLIGSTEGMVTNMGLLSTKIRTRLSEEVSIPNSVVLSDTTKNYSRYAADGLLIAERVSIGYSAPWRQIHAMLKEAAKHTPGLRKEPPPRVRQVELGDFYVVYELNVPVDSPGERLATLARLRANIQDEFNRHGVQILSPHYEGDPDQPAIVPPGQWHAPPATEDAAAD
jgi:small-conductance mechanosensitive channel